MTIKQVFKKIHLWLSIPIGLVFCMMCLTGSMMVFEE